MFTTGTNSVGFLATHSSEQSTTEMLRHTRLYLNHGWSQDFKHWQYSDLMATPTAPPPKSVIEVAVKNMKQTTKSFGRYIC